MRGGLTTLAAEVEAILDARLRPGGGAPLAVGLSGGGDSLALLILTLDWARARGRRVVAFCVDHGLNPQSAAWTSGALATARRLGAEARALVWQGEKPRTGLPAAARDARHRLLAAAAREVGAGVLLLGHTADDLAEAAAMRAEGSSVGDPREWAPSPVWPEGRGVFLLRPLLGVRRAALRDLLRERGETWFDDPANDDLRFARARARGRMKEPSAIVSLARGDASASRLSATILCAAGHDRPPRRREVDRLMARLANGEAFRATLGGARIEADASDVRLAREPGRDGLPELPLPPGVPVVWDGRYEITADAPGLVVGPLAGLAGRLPRHERTMLRGVPAFARPGLPVVLDSDGWVSCPILATHPRVRIVSLAMARWQAACGLVTREIEGDDPARGETERGVLSWGREFRAEGR